MDNHSDAVLDAGPSVAVDIQARETTPRFPLWSPVPYRTVNLVDIRPPVGKISACPRVSLLVERVTNAAVFAAPPAQPALASVDRAL